MVVYPKFSQYVHYVLLNGEFIILDEQGDRYIILEAPASLELETALIEGNDQSALVQELLSERILELSSQRQPIRRVTVQEHGIGDYEWRFARQFHQTVSIKWMSLRALQILLWIKTLLSTRGFHTSMNSLRALKAAQAHSIRLPNDSSEHNRICECAANAIAEVALWVPYRVE